MWRWAVLWQTCTLLLAGATFDFRFFGRGHAVPNPQVNCFGCIPESNRNGRAISEVSHPWYTTEKITNMTSTKKQAVSVRNGKESVARRIGRLLPNAEDIVKEHAKLVQDINGLRQMVFVRPLVEDNRDYDESILQEIIEISTTSRPTPRPSTPRPLQLRPVKGSSSFPVILLGGASQHEIVKTQPMRFSKPINLVGTSVSPLAKHPYPFVMHGSSQKPLKFCLNSMHLMYTTTSRPSLLQRLLNSILPRGR